MTDDSYRKQYERANQYRKIPFVERPYFGSPGAPAQAETNSSNIWGHINGGFLFAYEYTRWWKESEALRKAAIVGDWSWLNKTLVSGPDADRFMSHATVKDISKLTPGRIMYTPMVNQDGKIAIEGLTWRLDNGDYMFTQSGGMSWLSGLRALTEMKVQLDDVTADYTCYAMQGPRSLEILEALTGESFADMRFSRWRKTRILGEEVIVGRQGVTGEVGYEFLMRTDTGKAHELWRLIREVGKGFGLRELGFKAQLVGHTETGIATVIRDFMPARANSPDAARKFARLWTTEEELDALDWSIADQYCSPAELGWGYTIHLDHEFHGRQALVEEAAAGGPRRKLVGLMWNSDDMAALYAALFRDGSSAPPPDLPYGQFRMLFLKVLLGDRQVGWASGYAYSINLRRMISLARLDKALAVPGTEVKVIWGGFSGEPTAEIRARVEELPFIKQNRRNDLAAT